MSRMVTLRRTLTPTPKISRETGGAAALEFALIAPMLVLLSMGVLIWGGWFWMAHSVQQLANDAARASVAGMDAAERRELARAQVARSAGDLGGIRPERLDTVVTEAEGDVRVEVTYDARDVLPDFSDITVAPDPRIRRSARVRAGGF